VFEGMVNMTCVDCEICTLLWLLASPELAPTVIVNRLFYQWTKPFRRITHVILSTYSSMYIPNMHNKLVDDTICHYQPH